MDCQRPDGQLQPVLHGSLAGAWAGASVAAAAARACGSTSTPAMHWWPLTVCPVAYMRNDAALVLHSAGFSSCRQHLNASLVLASSGAGHTALRSATGRGHTCMGRPLRPLLQSSEHSLSRESCVIRNTSIQTATMRLSLLSTHQPLWKHMCLVDVSAVAWQSPHCAAGSQQAMLRH